MSQASASGQELQGLIRDIQAGFSAFYTSVLTPRDVSIAQFAVLVCLAQQEPRKMSEIARATHVTMPGITHLVDRLQERGMVQRKPHPKDRRVSLVQLTAKGKELLTQTQGKAARMLTRNYGRYGTSEQAAIMKFMKGMREGIRGMIEDGSAAR